MRPKNSPKARIARGYGFALWALFFIVPAARADSISILSFPSVGPNNSLSLSWSQYASDALTSIETGGGNTGNPASDPTAYATVSALNPGDLILSSFPSWEGIADPSGAFAGEYGDQLLFGLQILGNGNYFRLSNLYNTMASSDAGDSLGGNSGGFSSYGPYLLGIDCGSDGICGTADDTIYQNGESASLPVNELFYVGVGAAFDATNEPGATNQDKLDSLTSFVLMNAPFSVSNTYTLYSDDATTVLGASSSTLTVLAPSSVPEPVSSALLGTGLAAMFLALACRRQGKLRSV